MSKSQVVLVCTTGRSGTVYLTRVLQHYAPTNIDILHEEIQPYHVEVNQGKLDLTVVSVPKLESLCKQDRTLVVTGRIGMSVFAHDALRLDPQEFDVKVLFMVRGLMETALSWLRHLSRHQLGADYLRQVAGPVWWHGHDEIRFNPEWSHFQIAVWHWFMTYLHGIELVEHAGDENVRGLSFQHLGDVHRVGEAARWVLGSNFICDEQVLEDCKKEGTFHATKKIVLGDVDVDREYVDWMTSLSRSEAAKVNSVTRPMSMRGFGYEL